MAENDLAHILLSRFGSLENMRSTWESHWQEIADYVVPRKAAIAGTMVRFSSERSIEVTAKSL